MTGLGGRTNCAASDLTDAVLHEVASLVACLVRDADFAGAIDLRSLPLGDTDRAQLRGRLGRGEVAATADAAGGTQVTETSYSGVWWVRSCSEAGEVLFEHIVVARVPAILLAHAADIDDAAHRLRRELEMGAAATATAREAVHE